MRKPLIGAAAMLLTTSGLLLAAPAHATGPCYGGQGQNASQACADCITTWARSLQPGLGPCYDPAAQSIPSQIYKPCAQAGVC
jgi:hypothetical protein